MLWLLLKTLIKSSCPPVPAETSTILFRGERLFSIHQVSFFGTWRQFHLSLGTQRKEGWYCCKEMLIVLWGSLEEITETFVAGRQVLLSLALCFSTDFWKMPGGQGGRVEFITILKGRRRAELNFETQRALWAVLNWVCLFTANACSAKLVGMDGDLLSPPSVGWVLLLQLWFLVSGLVRAAYGSDGPPSVWKALAAQQCFLFWSLRGAQGASGGTCGARRGRRMLLDWQWLMAYAEWVSCSIASSRNHLLKTEPRCCEFLLERSVHSLRQPHTACSEVRLNSASLLSYVA